VFIFGGHHNPQSRLNDAWYFKFKDLEWSRIGEHQDNTSNQESNCGAPAPRANMGACIYNGKIYIFGGHGGLNYQRIAFNDLYTFDLETEAWEKLSYANTAPDGRGGHSVFASDEKVYIYGGWNSEQQYNNILIFDLEKKEWSDPDIYNEIHRWNHCSVLVEAIPTWKFFIFGGECAEYNEGNPRAFGEYVNSSCFLDLGTVKWTTYASDKDLYPEMPCPREYAAMAYDPRDSKLIVYGGWNNGWFNDLYSLTVSKIVGPSYAITSSDPCLGQLSGNVPLTIKGQGFKDASIKVLFTCGNKPVDNVGKMTIEVPGQFVSENELTCLTPNFEQFGPKEAVLQLSIANADLTTTWITFQYFLNTRANKSLAYGPGLLRDACPGAPVEFVIQARNDLGENRISGRDKWQVRVRKINSAEEAEENAPEELDAEGNPIPKRKVFAQEESVHCEIIDRDDGCYDCKYQIDEECEARVEILFFNDKEEWVQVRGSPYRASFSNAAKPADNLMHGAIMDRQIKKELERIHLHLQDVKKETFTKDKDMKDVKVLLGVKEHVDNTTKNTDKITLEID